MKNVQTIKRMEQKQFLKAMKEKFAEKPAEDLSWLPKVCEHCKAPAELVLSNQGYATDKNGTWLVRFWCRNCGEITLVKYPMEIKP
jgi:hypothetical protein